MNHLDNFGTNLTSGTSASDTSSPVNSVPSIAAPFWVAFDATNINNHYETKLITSKTATNILHSALSYDHTTAEEVRIVNPAAEFDALVTGWGTPLLTRRVFEQADSLRIIAHSAGTVKRMLLECAHEYVVPRKICVYSANREIAYNAAEHTIGLMIMMSRQLASYQLMIQNDRNAWPNRMIRPNSQWKNFIRQSCR